jgi:hypothetical protein
MTGDNLAAAFLDQAAKIAQSAIEEDRRSVDRAAMTRPKVEMGRQHLSAPALKLEIQALPKTSVNQGAQRHRTFLLAASRKPLSQNQVLKPPSVNLGFCRVFGDHGQLATPHLPSPPPLPKYRSR